MNVRLALIQAVDAALRFRSQAPLVDALMAELGLAGGSLSALVKSAGIASADLMDGDPAEASPAS